MVPLTNKHHCSHPEAEGDCSDACTLCHKPTRPRLVRKRVSFCPVALVRHTLHINDYSLEEVKACWYDATDSKRIKHDVLHAAKLLSKGLLEQDTNDYCRRGLEGCLKSYASARVKTRMAVQNVVFDEQHLQWEMGFPSDESIAVLSRHASMASAIAARKLAIEDRCAVTLS